MFAQQFPRAISKRRIHDVSEVFPIRPMTPEEEKWYESTAKVDANDIPAEKLHDEVLEMWEKGFVVYDGNSPRMTMRTLRSRFPELREYVIQDVLRRGEIMNVVAPPKKGKSFLSAGLCVSIVTGLSWLNVFSIPNPGKVLLIDNELHEETLADRLNQICKAMQIEPEEIDQYLEVMPLRGDLVSLEELPQKMADIYPGEFRLIILDAFYKFMPPRTDENDNGAMANLYNQLDRIAKTIDACIVVIHHTTKGNQSGKEVTDIGAGGGVQSRACDVHVVMLPHEDDNCIVLKSAVRSSRPVPPIGLRLEWPLWQHDPNLDVEAIKGAKDDDDFGEKKRAESWTQKFQRHKQFALDFVTRKEGGAKLADLEGAANAAGLTITILKKALGEMVTAGILKVDGGKGRGNNKTYILGNPNEAVDHQKRVAAVEAMKNGQALAAPAPVAEEGVEEFLG